MPIARDMGWRWDYSASELGTLAPRLASRASDLFLVEGPRLKVGLKPAIEIRLQNGDRLQTVETQFGSSND